MVTEHGRLAKTELHMTSLSLRRSAVSELADSLLLIFLIFLLLLLSPLSSTACDLRSSSSHTCCGGTFEPYLQHIASKQQRLGSSSSIRTGNVRKTKTALVFEWQVVIVQLSAEIKLESFGLLCCTGAQKLLDFHFEDTMILYLRVVAHLHQGKWL